MMDKEEYKKEIVRMWDSAREISKGKPSCAGVICNNGCPLNVKNELGRPICWSSADCFEVIKVVEKWSKEHPPKKYKVSRLEYDILQDAYSIYGNFRMYQHEIINNLREKGYFKGADEKMNIDYYFNNCEVKENDDN